MVPYSCGHTAGTTRHGTTESIGRRDEGDLTMGLDPSSPHIRIRLCLHCAYGTHHVKCSYAFLRRGLHTAMNLDDETET
jgi:hypothetical protein